MSTQQNEIKSAEVFIIPSQPLYKLVVSGESAIAHACTADDIIDGVEDLSGKLPAVDLALAALHKFALLERNPTLMEFAAVLDEVINK